MFRCAAASTSYPAGTGFDFREAQCSSILRMTRKSASTTNTDSTVEISMPLTTEIRLLDDALLASRVGAGDLSEELLGLQEIARGEVEDRRSAGAPVDLIVAPEAGGITILRDRLALRRVIANLIEMLSNTVKALTSLSRLPLDIPYCLSTTGPRDTRGNKGDSHRTLRPRRSIALPRYRKSRAGPYDRSKSRRGTRWELEI